MLPASYAEETRLFRVYHFLFLSIMLMAAGCSPVKAVEINLFTYGPSFSIVLNPASDAFNQHLRNALLKHRQANTEMKVYDTTAKFARAERATLEKLLRASGYYQSKVDYSISDDAINYRVVSGPLYHIRAIRFDIPEEIHWPDGARVGINAGDPLASQAVLDSLEHFKKRIARHNCLLNIDVDYLVLLDMEHAMAELAFSVNPSDQAVFNDISLSGLTSVDEEFLRRKIKIKQGDCFKRLRLDKARLALLQSNLIAAVDQIISAPDKGQVDVEFRLTERNHRTVKTGLGYSTDEHGIISLGWEHRNLFGAGQKFTADTRLSQVLQSIDGRLTFPEMFRSDQTFELYGELAQEKRDSYESRSIIGGGVMTRELTQEVSASAGVRLKLSSILDQQGRDEYTLLSAPASTTWNTTTDLLDPLDGWILTAQLIPYTDLLNVGTRFLKVIGSGSAYYTEKRIYGEPTFAVRGSTGALMGATLSDIPADERYYGGGGGSVRGYAYQSLSQYLNGDPIGGRSFIEMSLETRFHHGKNWGTVLFSDGGFADENTTPKWNNTLRWSAGVGLRYFTAATPLRLDIAWPLNRRAGIDDAFQLYISLGQAF